MLPGPPRRSSLIHAAETGDDSVRPEFASSKIDSGWTCLILFSYSMDFDCIKFVLHKNTHEMKRMQTIAGQPSAGLSVINPLPRHHLSGGIASTKFHQVSTACRSRFPAQADGTIMESVFLAGTSGNTLSSVIGAGIGLGVGN